MPVTADHPCGAAGLVQTVFILVKSLPGIRGYAAREQAKMVVSVNAHHWLCSPYQPPIALSRPHLHPQSCEGSLHCHSNCAQFHPIKLIHITQSPE